MPKSLVVAGYDPYRDAEGFVYCPERALAGIEFFERALVHVKGPLRSKPILLEDWQKRVVANLLGWREPDSGWRRYQGGLFYVPRKNTKTTVAAGLGDFFFFCEPEHGGEIYCGARDGRQAEILYGIASKMVHEGPLRGRCTVFKRQMKRWSPEYGDLVFEALNAQGDSKHGLNASVFFADETHTYQNRSLFDAIDTSMAAREQPLTLSLTTAGEVGKSLCNDQLAYAKAVRDGEIPDARYLPIVYETQPDDDWTDPDTWRAANPNLGVSVSEEYLRRKCEQAKVDPHYEGIFRRLHLNCQVQRASTWLPRDLWRRLERVELEELAGEVCYAGVDLAATQDLAAVALWFPARKALVVRQFAPEARAREREVRGRYPSYFAWQRRGHLTLIPGEVLRYDWILEQLWRLTRGVELESVGIDPWNAHEFAERVESAGVDVKFVKQGWGSLSPPAKELHRLILAGELVHDHCPVMDWQVGHCMAATDAAGNVKPDKAKSDEKIDGIAAAITAMARAEREDRQMEIFGL